MNESTRWNQWMGRARACFRAASAIDNSASAVTTTTRELEGAEDVSVLEAVEALRAAEAALLKARAAVQVALKAKKLVAANREPQYGLVG